MHYFKVQLCLFLFLICPTTISAQSEAWINTFSIDDKFGDETTEIGSLGDQILLSTSTVVQDLDTNYAITRIVNLSNEGEVIGTNIVTKDGLNFRTNGNSLFNPYGEEQLMIQLLYRTNPTTGSTAIVFVNSDGSIDRILPMPIHGQDKLFLPCNILLNNAENRLLEVSYGGSFVGGRFGNISVKIRRLKLNGEEEWLNTYFGEYPYVVVNSSTIDDDDNIYIAWKG